MVREKWGWGLGEGLFATALVIIRMCGRVVWGAGVFWIDAGSVVLYSIFWHYILHYIS